MTHHRFNIWIPILLLLVCTVLAWVIYRQLAVAPSVKAAARELSAAATTVPELPLEPQFSMRPMEDFQAILERPIFSPSRRPPPVEPVGTPAPDSNVAFTLKGILIDQNERIALFRMKSSDKIVRLRQGDEIEGWILVQIEIDHVTLTRGGIETELEPTYDQPAPAERARRRKNSQDESQQQQNQE